MDRQPRHAWQVMHPPLQAHGQGLLEVGDGHRVYWEQCGHPGAPAALHLHGGPGAGCSEHDRRWFDPAHWRIVLMDQRGAGRSLPAGALHANTTPHLVRDIETLREHLGLPRWALVCAGSWGAALALAYAAAHPGRVGALLLRGVYTASAAERRWLWGDGHGLPGVLASNGKPPTGDDACHQAWQALRAAARPGLPLLDGLAAALAAADPVVVDAAARAWWRWEQALMAHEAVEAGNDAVAPVPPDVAGRARIGVHYARHGDFVGDAGLPGAGAAALAAIPGVVVQGLRDRVTPPAAARALLRSWPAAQWVEIAHAGHASHHPAMAQALVDAVTQLAPRRDGADRR